MAPDWYELVRAHTARHAVPAGLDFVRLRAWACCGRRSVRSMPVTGATGGGPRTRRARHGPYVLRPFLTRPYRSFPALHGSHVPVEDIMRAAAGLSLRVRGAWTFPGAPRTA